MKPVKIIATLAIGVGVAAGATGVSAGVANADPGPGVGPVPVGGAGRDHGTATDMHGVAADVDGMVPDGAAIPHLVAGTAAGNPGAGYAYSARAYRTRSGTSEHQSLADIGFANTRLIASARHGVSPSTSLHHGDGMTWTRWGYRRHGS
jgi:hypothetical protein